MDISPRIRHMARKPTSPTEQGSLFQLDQPLDQYKKSVELVHAKPNAALSLLQAKTIDCLLRNAYESGEPDEDGYFKITGKDLAASTGFDSKNVKYLKTTAESISSIRFVYDMFNNKTKADETVFVALFPVVKLSRATIHYKVEESLKELVRNPEVYALLDSGAMKRFARAASIPLYQHCARFINLGKTPKIAWETLRDILLGAKSGDGTYAEFKFFNAFQLKPAIAEVNAFSEITIDKMHTDKEGRFISAVWFEISPKTKNLKATQDERYDAIQAALKEIGINSSEARRLLQNHRVAELDAALNYTKRRIEDTRTGKLDNPAAYFRSTLENRWAIVEADATEAGRKEETPEAKAANNRRQLEEAFQLHQVEEARSHFSGLDDSERKISIARYNDQQQLRLMQIREGKKSHAQAQTAFLRWYAKDRWGEPTEAQLLDYASSVLSGNTTNTRARAKRKNS